MRTFTAAIAFVASVTTASAQEVLMAGDSILAWNRESGESVGQFLTKRTDLDVRDVSQSGALFDGGWFDFGGDIQGQIDDAQPAFLIFNGGGNDLGDVCGTAKATDVLDNLIDDGLAGAFQDFVGPLAQSGTQVIYMAYYDMPSEDTEFSACRSQFVALEDRMRRLASRIEGLHFVSGRDVIDATDQGNYDRDGVHPSPSGSALLADALHNKLQALR